MTIKLEDLKPGMVLEYFDDDMGSKNINNTIVHLADVITEIDVGGDSDEPWIHVEMVAILHRHTEPVADFKIGGPFDSNANLYLNKVIRIISKEEALLIQL